jgi:dephospho-CoA kinase
MIPTIGIVGGIGSGKSLVAHAMQKLGGHLIDADLLGHQALEQTDIKGKLLERWGIGILDERGQVDRQKIGRIVFADPHELRALEALVFPFIEKRILEEMAHARSRMDVEFIILDAAIMLETGWDRHCDKIVFVEAPRGMRLARLKEKRGWSERELERRENVQLPVEEKKRRGDGVIVNDADIEKVSRQVKVTLEQWKVIC